jgi:dihydrofolate reductase
MMAKLIYSAISSLDGYVADVEGKFDWSVPDEELHRFVNDLDRPIGTHLYGRRMYEVMRAWETVPTNVTCSSPPSWWEAARRLCPISSVSSSSC